MLVVRGHDAWSDVCAPWDCLAVFVLERNCRQDTGCADLELDVGCLIEDEGEDVFVVGDGADHLDDELAVTDDCCLAAAVVGMLVLKTVVLLVHTDDVLQLNRCTLCICAVTVEILDVAEAVAAKTKLIGCNTEADIADVEGLFAMVGGTGVYDRSEEPR